MLGTGSSWGQAGWLWIWGSIRDRSAGRTLKHAAHGEPRTHFIGLAVSAQAPNWIVRDLQACRTNWTEREITLHGSQPRSPSTILPTSSLPVFGPLRPRRGRNQRSRDATAQGPKSIARRVGEGSGRHAAQRRIPAQWNDASPPTTVAKPPSTPTTQLLLLLLLLLVLQPASMPSAWRLPDHATPSQTAAPTRHVQLNASTACC